MKRITMIALFLAAACAPAFAQTASGAGNKTEQAVLKVVDDVLQALVKRDAAVLEQNLTNDFYTVYDNGQVGDRKLLLDSLKSTTSGWDAFERIQTKVKVAGNAALVLCETKAKRHTPRGNADLHWQTTVGLLNERGQWRLIGAQFTLIKPPAQQ
jgi:hypothetical protein